MTKFKDYFYGHKISEYGLKNGYVDYRTFAQAFDAVLNNDIMAKTYEIGYWEQVSGNVDNTEEIEEIKEQVEELEETAEEIREKIEELEEAEEANEGQLKELKRDLAGTEEEIERLEEEQTELEEAENYPPEVFQYYIIDDNGARICEEFNEIVFYNEELDLYLWGVTHWGTAWDYVLTDIKCEKVEN